MKIVSETFCPDFSVPEVFLSGDDVFFDIETTGLNWRKSHLYLIGAAVFRPESGLWELTQWFADQPARELDLLEAFADFLRPFRRLIHYNGTGFDLPYLRNKYEFYHLENPFASMGTLDLYLRFRPYQRLFGLSSMKQKSLEAFAGFSRKDRFSGGELIEVYENYLSSADDSLLQTLYLHNREDLTGMVQILSLYGIPSLFSGRFQLSGVSFRNADRESGGHVPEAKNAAGNMSLSDREPQVPGSAGSPVLVLTLALEFPVDRTFHIQFGPYSLTVSGKKVELSIPGQERELKFFFPNYKDYYYLPMEDAAIHKSVGAYVDAGHREKAKAANCYQRHSALYFPQPSELLSPVFREDYRAKQLYFEWKDDLKEDRAFLTRYAAAVLSEICSAAYEE